jgi:hypothetical protein
MCPIVCVKFSFLHCIRDALGPYFGADAGYIVCTSSWFSHSPSIKTQGTWYLKSGPTASFRIFKRPHSQTNASADAMHSLNRREQQLIAYIKYVYFFIPTQYHSLQ